MEPVLAPVGFNWQIDVALVPGMAAQEVAVAALGTVYAIEGGGDARDKLGEALAGRWSLATALALLAWYVFAPQCASTLSMVRREAGGRRWALFLFAYMTALAYAAAFVTYRVAVGSARDSSRHPRLRLVAVQFRPHPDLLSPALQSDLITPASKESHPKGRFLNHTSGLTAIFDTHSTEIDAAQWKKSSKNLMNIFANT